MPVTKDKLPPYPQPNKWGSYAIAWDFSANMLIALVLLFCGFLFACVLNSAIHCLLLAHRRRGQVDDPEKHAGASKKMSTLPILLFSAGTKMTGADAGCAICLGDFVKGDGIRVLPACNHGFHVQCVDRWLAARPSCPTCRTSCPT